MVTNRDGKSFGSCRKKFQKLFRRLAPLKLLIRFQAFGDPLRGELPHVQIFMNDGPRPLTWDAQVLRYWFSRNPAVFLDYLVNLNNNLRGGHSFGSSRTRHIQVEKSPRLNWATQFLTLHTMVHVPLLFLSEWREFPSAPCLAGKIKLDDSSRLYVVEIAHVAWHASFQPL